MKKISLVLGSGGARGYAHIGVIEELEKHGYEIVSISGASMGALIGGLYACGKLNAYKAWVLELDALDVASLLDISFSRGGIIEGEKVFGKLSKIIGRQRIEELPLKFTAVATDIVKQKEVWFQQGDLLEAIRASIAIPSVFTPVKMGKMVLVDGGALNPLPVAPTQSDLTDLTIAVNLYGEIPKPKLKTEATETARKNKIERVVKDLFTKAKEDKKFTMFDVLDKTFDTMQDALTRYRIGGYPPDIMIDISMHVCNTFDFHKAAEVIEAGRLATRERLKTVKESRWNG
ncbi:patatin-like phospholipase family protein [Hydrogenimonas cancrithermarum]|uniref:Serine protease n=1 Tax=Hydrogenimonas cancrithermarum TaxID=2993563 RepID=A0ABN6WS72_9BACT|nr:patatin-like phospholipase family protein [Hydrogenimonas cancrithermarum]BDY11808.1 serine protease [Hydrogenimonas cancrithermarum]